MDGDRHPAGHNLDGGFGEQLALVDGQIERLALMVWPRNRRRAGAHMEIEQPLECRQIEAEVVLERRDRALHHAAEFVLHDGSRQNRGGSPAYAWPMMFARSALPTGRGWVILTAATTSTALARSSSRRPRPLSPVGSPSRTLRS